jgi:hypothetical protein
MVLGLIENSNIKFYLFQVEVTVEQLWHFYRKGAKFFNQ